MASRVSLFLAELKRRRVTRVAVGYVLVGLGVIEGASMILPTLRLDAAYPYIVILVLFGFPLALVLAWALEVTPEGIQRTQDLTPDQVASHTPARWGASTWVLAGISLALVAVLGYSVLPKGGSSDLPETVIAVMPFENLTGDEGLDDIGRMASLVLTQALEKTGLVTVKPFDLTWSADEYVKRLSAGGGVTDKLRAFAEELDAGTIVHGAYGLDAGRLRVSASVSDVAGGKSLRSPDPISGEPGSPMSILDTLTTRVIGALALGFDEGLAPYVTQTGTAPTWEAAQEFQQGVKIYLGSGTLGLDSEGATERFLRAHELDPSFFTPLIYAGWAVTNFDTTSVAVALRDSIWGVLFQNESSLSPYEKAIVQSWRAFQAGDRNRYVEASGEACGLAPGSKACFNYGKDLLGILHQPRRSFEVFSTQLEPEKGSMRGFIGFWNWSIWAYYMAGEYTDLLDHVQQGRGFYPNNYNFHRHKLYALIGLGRVEEVSGFLADSLEAFPNLAAHSFLSDVGDVLFRHGYREEARRAWEACLELSQARVAQTPSNPGRHFQLGWVYYRLGMFREAEDHFIQAKTLGLDVVDLHATIGVLAAAQGDREEARRVQDWLDESLPDESSRYSWKAEISAALGERDEAVAFLKRAMNDPDLGETMESRKAWYFGSLHGYEPFDDLLFPYLSGEG